VKTKGYVLRMMVLTYLLGCAPPPSQVAVEATAIEDSGQGAQHPNSAQSTALAPTGEVPTNVNVQSELLSSDSQELMFEDYTSKAGIDFSYSNGRSANEYAIVESLGGGVGIFDYDNDGLADVMFSGGGTLDNRSVQSRRCGLFRNLGDWTFVATTEVAHAAADYCFTHGIATADIDADGFEDVAVSGYGAVQVLINQGDGTFVAWEPLITHATNAWSSSLAWADLDNNGHLDLYVAHYVDWSWEKHPICAGQGVPREVCAPREFNGLTDAIYFNDGHLPLRRESESVGLSTEGKGLGVIVGDFNADNAIDVYVANDTTDNFLYINQGKGTFTESAVFAGVSGDDAGVSTGSMGVCMLDYNGDLLPDLLVTNFERELSALYRNEGTAGFFSFASRQAGLASYGSNFVGFGIVAVDFNFDNQQDIVIANGHVSYHSPHAPYRQIPLLLENLGAKFQLRQTAGYFSLPHTGRGLASGDFDNDGAKDLAISHLEEPVSLLRGQPLVEQLDARDNDTAGAHREKMRNAQGVHWGIIRLVGVIDNRSAIGAALHWEIAGKQHSLFNAGGGSYLSSCERRFHVYWPSDSEAPHIEVCWPNGSREIFKILGSQESVFRQGTGQVKDAR